MEPIEAAQELAKVASECMNLLALVAAPKMHARIAQELPKGTTATQLAELFRSFQRAAAQFERHRGHIGGFDRFLRGAKTLGKMQDALVSWEPTREPPPEAIVVLARLALRHLGAQEPACGWDAYEGNRGEDAAGRGS